MTPEALQDRNREREFRVDTNSASPTDLIPLLTVVSIIVLAAIIPVRYWPAHGCLFVFVFILHSCYRVPLRWLGRRLGLFLPVIAVFAASVSLLNGIRSGGELSASIFVRSAISFFALLWLIRAVPFVRLTNALAYLGVPVMFVSMLQMMQRYFGILWDEQRRMRDARRARSFVPVSRTAEWIGLAQMLGMLLIRALTRAERVHLAMQARGWDGRRPPLGSIHPRQPSDES